MNDLLPTWVADDPVTDVIADSPGQRPKFQSWIWILGGTCLIGSGAVLLVLDRTRGCKIGGIASPSARSWPVLSRRSTSSDEECTDDEEASGRLLAT